MFPAIFRRFATTTGTWSGAAKIAHDISDRRRGERVVQFLAHATDELSTLVDFQSTMQRIARLAVPFFADWCVVDMIDAHGQIRPASPNAHADRNKEAILKEFVERYPLDIKSSALSAWAMRSGQPQLRAELSPEFLNSFIADARHRELFGVLTPRSAVSAPIVIRNATVGSLNFVAAESGRRYSPADLELATELARRAGVAIENAQLLRDVKEAQRQKDDFLAMLAHELRNPISAIQYANELSRLAGPDHSQTQEVIDRQVRNLNRLMEDLLDVSRITRDKIELRREHVDGAVVVARAVATAEPQIKLRKHTLTVTPAAGPLPLFVDPTRAEQILVNLLTNAAKYTPDSGRITVAAHADGDSAVFQVSDNGIGIPAAMLPRVFDLFTQVDPSFDRSQGGLGIGLTVVLKAGRVAWRQRCPPPSDGPGQGSTFTVRFPLIAAPTEPPKQPAAKPASAEPRKILVVDDNTDAAQSLGILLKASGHTIETAYDGLAAVSAAKAFQPDSILLDLGLPGLDGFKVARAAARPTPTSSGPASSRLSGYGQLQDRQQLSPRLRLRSTSRQAGRLRRTDLGYQRPFRSVAARCGLYHACHTTSTRQRGSAAVLPAGRRAGVTRFRPKRP